MRRLEKKKHQLENCRHYHYCPPVHDAINAFLQSPLSTPTLHFNKVRAEMSVFISTRGIVCQLHCSRFKRSFSSVECRIERTTASRPRLFPCPARSRSNATSSGHYRKQRSLNDLRLDTFTVDSAKGMESDLPAGGFDNDSAVAICRKVIMEKCLLTKKTSCSY